MSSILVTGAAGFIGMHVASRLLDAGHEVVGIDSLNSYYSVALKRARLAILESRTGFEFHQLDLSDRAATNALFASRQFPRVVHLAAQAGVRHAIVNPAAYVDSNLVGFGNLLEGCRHGGCEHLLFASSSSVYGGNDVTPFSERHAVDHPLSLYAATKRANELMAHSYSHLFNLPVTGVRFFTVYGPWGRPDMALSLFADAILKEQPLRVFNEGRLSRDYTYVADIVESVMRLLNQRPEVADGQGDGDQRLPDRSPLAPFRIFNIGNRTPVPLLELIRKLADALGKTPQLELLPMQPGDVEHTCADISAVETVTAFVPNTTIDDGIKAFVQWFVEHNAGKWQ